MPPRDAVNDELVRVLGMLPTAILEMANEALDRYVAYGRWNAYNAEDLERISKLTEKEKVNYDGHIRVIWDGDELSDEEIGLAKKFMDALIGAMDEAEAREESPKMIDEIEDYLKGEG